MQISEQGWPLAAAVTVTASAEEGLWTEEYSPTYLRKRHSDRGYSTKFGYME
jgi:hypothetical protein